MLPPANERLAEAGVEPSVGSVGDFYDLDDPIKPTLSALFRSSSEATTKPVSTKPKQVQLRSVQITYRSQLA